MDPQRAALTATLSLYNNCIPLLWELTFAASHFPSETPIFPFSNPQIATHVSYEDPDRNSPALGNATTIWRVAMLACMHTYCSPGFGGQALALMVVRSGLWWVSAVCRIVWEANI